MRIIALATLVVAVFAFAAPSCSIGGDEPWDAEGSDTDADADSDGDGDSDSDTSTEDLDGDAGLDGGVDAG